MGGVARAIEILTAPGDGVVLTPPVYGPFRQAIERLGRVPVDAPMRYSAGSPGRWSLDVGAIDAALAAGARAVLLCNPHNPTGSIPTAAELAALRDAAARTGAGIISDEVWAPLDAARPHVHPAARTRRAAGAHRHLGVEVVERRRAEMRAADRGRPRDRGSGRTAARRACAIPVTSACSPRSAAFTAAAEGDGWLDAVTAHLARQHERARALLAAALARRSSSRPPIPAT